MGLGDFLPMGDTVRTSLTLDFGMVFQPITAIVCASPSLPFG
jgi:hypothetical protein